MGAPGTFGCGLKSGDCLYTWPMCDLLTLQGLAEEGSAVESASLIGAPPICLQIKFQQGGENLHLMFKLLIAGDNCLSSWNPSSRVLTIVA